MLDLGLRDPGNFYASINFSGAHAPPGNRGAFAHVVSPGVGQSQILQRPGGWALAYPPGRPPGICHTCFRKMNKFIRKDEAFVKAKASRRRKAISALTCVTSLTQCLFFCARESQESSRSKKRKTVPLCRNDGTSYLDYSQYSLRRNRSYHQKVMFSYKNKIKT